MMTLEKILLLKQSNGAPALGPMDGRFLSSMATHVSLICARVCSQADTKMMSSHFLNPILRLKFVIFGNSIKFKAWDMVCGIFRPLRRCLKICRFTALTNVPLLMLLLLALDILCSRSFPIPYTVVVVVAVCAVQLATYSRG